MINNFDENSRELIANVNLEKRKKIKEERSRLYDKKYLGEIVKEECPKFEKNNLILAPVGSGKSYLIEEIIIPKDYVGKILYLTSNTALKDSICPDDSEVRKILAKKGRSIGFFTSKNKERFGDRKYSVHVMTYHEFALKILPPNEVFTKDIDVILCDEIHSLPIYNSYGKNQELIVAMRWLFQAHENKTIYYFTATRDSLDRLNVKIPGMLANVKEFDYLNHPNIRRYEAKSTYYVRHITQLRKHLRARLETFDRNGYKTLAFSKLIEEQEKISELAVSEGFKPIVLWSINSKFKMNEEQLRVRSCLLDTGYIPEPYNFLIINGSMQEGWNLFDDKIELAILDTFDETEKVQALGRIRKDIDFLILKSNDVKKVMDLELEDKYINTYLTYEQKEELILELNIRNNRGLVAKWPTVKKVLENNGYKVTEKRGYVDGERKRVSIITM